MIKIGFESRVSQLGRLNAVSVDIKHSGELNLFYQIDKYSTFNFCKTGDSFTMIQRNGVCFKSSLVKLTMIPYNAKHIAILI